MEKLDTKLKRIGLAQGTYALIVQLNLPKRIKVGRLGILTFRNGRYLYTGSALGPGGLSGRIRRHLRPANEKRPHWHIDALLSRGAVKEVWWMEGVNHLECKWAEVLSNVGDRSVLGFGASDCHCAGHLVWLRDAYEIERAWQGLREYAGAKLRRARNTETLT